MLSQDIRACCGNTIRDRKCPAARACVGVIVHSEAIYPLCFQTLDGCWWCTTHILWPILVHRLPIPVASLWFIATSGVILPTKRLNSLLCGLFFCWARTSKKAAHLHDISYTWSGRQVSFRRGLTTTCVAH